MQRRLGRLIYHSVRSLMVLFEKQSFHILGKARPEDVLERERASQRHLGSPQGGSEGHWGSPGGPVGEPLGGRRGVPWHLPALSDPLGGPRWGGRGPSATQRVVPRDPGGHPGGGSGPWRGSKELQRQPLRRLSDEEASLQNRCFYCMKWYILGSGGGPGLAQRRLRGAEDTTWNPTIAQKRKKQDLKEPV